MFGFYTQIQFSVFKSKNSRVPPLNILFGYCFLYLFSNTNTILLILKSILLRTTFCCFLKLYLFSFNKIIIFFLFISSAPLTIIGILSLSLPFLFLGGFFDARGGRGGVAVVAVESRQAWAVGSPKLRLMVWRPGRQIWRPSTTSSSTTDLEIFLMGVGYLVLMGTDLLWICCGFVGGLAHGRSQWLEVGLFRGGSGWFLVHQWCWVVRFGSPMGRDGLLGGLWWFLGGSRW